jgi:predicted transcriptional regulator
MKSRRDPFTIKKDILQMLKKYGEISLRELDIKVNTNYKTIRKQIEELEFFGKVEIIKHKKSKINGRPYTSVKLKN